MARLRIIIEPDGRTTTKVEGVSGPSCHTLSRELALELGTVEAETRTGEFFENPQKTPEKKKAKVTA